ncbi:Tubulin-specific chaperone [Trichinella pseudospiralis]|uniref:Tubulin-specific chaperone A n=1 Tax=Trichinella pseudospiralis TaxID=6337 RepID=A0A0V1G2D7_TRIPS|nr:Tubulin-specific chaperone A [Trichinella pseudospiralis]KRY92411.1 Tubulin-specific chaperone A [Trichinella pseudospiralis]
MANRRRLFIQTNVVNRLMNDQRMYLQEFHSYQAQLQQLRHSNEDPDAILKMSKLVDESLMMVNDSAARLNNASKELCDLIKDLAALGDEEDVALSHRAKRILEEAQTVISSFVPPDPM